MRALSLLFVSVSEVMELLGPSLRSCKKSTPAEIKSTRITFDAKKEAGPQKHGGKLNMNATRRILGCNRTDICDALDRMLGAPYSAPWIAWNDLRQSLHWTSETRKHRQSLQLWGEGH